MRKLSEIIKYIIETKSIIRYFVMIIDRENPQRQEISISYVLNEAEFKNILFDITLEEAFRILRDNHFDVIDTDGDVLSLYATSHVMAVFTNILNIERIRYLSDNTGVVFLNNNFPGNSENFYIGYHSDLKEIFAAHGRYDLALMF